MQSHYYTRTDTPVGRLTLVATDKALCALDWENSKSPFTPEGMQRHDAHPLLRHAIQQLHEYFSGTRRQFDIPLAMQGSVFQLKTWRTLQTIPYGETISYGEQAKRLGDAKKARAVGAANGRNPISIIVPCHRVIGASGALTGFGGGLKTKQFLLELEEKYSHAAQAA